MSVGRWSGAVTQGDGVGMEARSVSPHRVCANCGGTLANIGPRSKWCDRCSTLAVGVKNVRDAIRILSATGWSDAAERLRRVVEEIAPKGNVSRADYIAGRSAR